MNPDCNRTDWWGKPKEFLNEHIQTYIVPDVVGTIGISSASKGIDQGIWNCGASSRITVLLQDKEKN